MSKLDMAKEIIREQLACGTSAEALARDLGVAPATMRTYINRHGLRPERAPAGVGGQLPEEGAPSREELQAHEIRELRRRLSAGRRQDVAEERIIQAVEAAVEAVPPPDTRTVVAPEYVRPRSGEAHHRQLLLLSDFHGGEVVDPAAVNGLNAYDWEIMEERVGEVIRAVRSHQRRSPELTGLDIGFLGDMCSGSNHQELAETNEFPLAEQGVKIGYLQAHIVEQLAAAMPDVRVFCVPGNHPRLPRKPAAKNVHDNMDWVAGLVMQQYLSANDRVTVTVPRAGSLFWEIAGRTCYVWHGDGIRSSMPGVPWGGVMRRTDQLQRQHPQRIDHFLLGHYHQANVVQSGRIIMNGSLKGVDEWVLKSFGGGDRPTQLLLTFDENRSRLTDVRYITPSAGL